jgi:hypothetical protein
MSDITKCLSDECPAKETCYRYTAPSSELQSYANYYHDGEKCDHYWPLDHPRELKRTEKGWLVGNIGVKFNNKVVVLNNGTVEYRKKASDD